MTKVEILTDFKDSGFIYYSGEVRILEKNTAEYFISNGWAKLFGENSFGKELNAQNILLEVHDSVQSSPTEVF